MAYGAGSKSSSFTFPYTIFIELRARDHPGPRTLGLNHKNHVNRHKMESKNKQAILALDNLGHGHTGEN
jgi:hypothetical protein